MILEGWMLKCSDKICVKNPRRILQGKRIVVEVVKNGESVFVQKNQKMLKCKKKKKTA